jgi:hypothetical protein
MRLSFNKFDENHPLPASPEDARTPPDYGIRVFQSAAVPESVGVSLIACPIKAWDFQ